MPTRFFSMVMACWVGAAWGQAVLTPEDRNLATQARILRGEGAAWTVPVNAHADAARSEATQLMRELERAQVGPVARPEGRGSSRPAGRVLAFASGSLGEAALDDLFALASSHPEVVVVFRGVADEARFAQSVMALQQRAAAYTPVAPVMIDPTLFRDHGVSQVPTLILLAEDQQTAVARVAGLSHPRWLLDKVNFGETGDFGVRGPVEPIMERDLIEVMQDRMAGIDWAARKDQAIARFWSGQSFITLPRANRARTRRLDPSIALTADLLDADGTVLVPRGTRINPLDSRPFTQALVVFDPLDAEQVAQVERRLPELAQHVSRVTLIVTRLDRADGWGSYQRVTDHFDAPVFKLTPEIQSRFELACVPSIVTAEDRHFVVEELAQSEERTDVP